LRLIQSGLKEQDIIHIAELLKSDGNVTTAQDRKLLVAGLRGKYDGIKSTIRQPSQQVEVLRNEVAPLETQKQEGLTMHNQKKSCRTYARKLFRIEAVRRAIKEIMLAR
jgi:hypothetical protein